MTRELFWLTLTVGLTGILWIPYIIDRIVVRGLMGAMANPSRNDKPQSEWAQRLYFAHTNAVDNIAVFAPLVLILNAIEHSTQATVIACAVYFWARLAHAIIYMLGIPVLGYLRSTQNYVHLAARGLTLFDVAPHRVEKDLAQWAGLCHWLDNANTRLGTTVPA